MAKQPSNPSTETDTLSASKDPLDGVLAQPGPEPLESTTAPAVEQEAPQGLTEGDAPVEGKAPAKPIVPSLQDLLDKGHKPAKALAILIKRMAVACGKSKEEAQELANLASQGAAGELPENQGKELDDPYYRVVAKRGRPFYRIGRPFTDAPVKVPVKSLSEAEIKELEASNPTFLDVTLVTHE